MQSAYEYCGAPPNKGALASSSFIISVANNKSQPTSSPTICRFWNAGCRAGASCRFLHPGHNGSNKTLLREQQCSPNLNNGHTEVSIKLSGSSSSSSSSSSLTASRVRDRSIFVQSSFSTLSLKNAPPLPTTNDFTTATTPTTATTTGFPSDGSPKSDNISTTGGSSWDDDDESLSCSSASSWDDPSHDVKTPPQCSSSSSSSVASAVRSRNGIVSLRPLATKASAQQRSSQDIRSGRATSKVTWNDCCSGNNDAPTTKESQTSPSFSRSSHYFPKRSSSNNDNNNNNNNNSHHHHHHHHQYEDIYECKSERYVSPRIHKPVAHSVHQQLQVVPSYQQPQCELVAPDGIVDSLPVLASIRGCDLAYVRHQLSLCFGETYSLLFNETTWAFFLPQGAVFSLELEKAQRGTKCKALNVYRLFGKPLFSPLKQVSKSTSVVFVLRTLDENALCVVKFLEHVLCVAFFERDANPDQPCWNRERLPGLNERIKVFLAGGHATVVDTENLRTLVPRCEDNVLEMDSETKRSTVAALSRLGEEPALPSRQPTPLAKVEQLESETEDDDDVNEEERKYLVLNGDVCTYPGYTLTFTQDHAEKQRALAIRLEERSWTDEPLVLRSHYTALGPETCLKLGPAARMLVSSPLAATAGCSHSSQISEALSAQLLLHGYGLDLHRTEMELEYVRPGPKIDFTCIAPCGALVGVSVTRAFKGDEHGKVRQFSCRTARALIAKKLNGLNKAWESISSDQKWQYGILHVWVPTFRNAVLVERAFRDFFGSNSLFVPVALLVTSTSFDCPIDFAYIYNHFS